MTIIKWADHTAHLDEMIGVGVLVRPNALNDLTLTTPTSLHAADWDRVVSDLHSRGWEPLEASDGGLTIEGYTEDGRMVIALYGRDSIVSNPGLEEIVTSTRELRRSAGLAYAGA